MSSCNLCGRRFEAAIDGVQACTEITLPNPCYDIGGLKLGSLRSSATKRSNVTTPVAIRFAWRATDSLIAAKTAELHKYMRDEKLSTVGEPLFAFYDPPLTLTFLRRNGNMLELAET